MNLLNARLKYDITYMLPLASDTYLDSFSIPTEINKYRYPLDIFPQEIFNNPYDSINNIGIMDIYNYLVTQCTFLFQNYYNSDEINILAAYLTSFQIDYGRYEITDTFLTLIQSLFAIQSTKEEIVYCRDELKFKLAVQFISKRINQTQTSQYLDDLLLIDDDHNAITIFGNQLVP